MLDVVVKDDDTRTPTLPKESATASPTADRAHILNKDAHEKRALTGPGSLDPKTLAPPANADAKRWLAKRGVELLVPADWRFLGVDRNGTSVSFNHTGNIDGHNIELAIWQLADDTPLEKFLAPYVEEADELVRLGRLSGHHKQKLGDADGMLFVGWGPDDRSALDAADPEDLYLATDGTGRRKISWRGARDKNGERQLFILSFSSPIETFMEARAVYDAVLDRSRFVV